MWWTRKINYFSENDTFRKAVIDLRIPSTITITPRCSITVWTCVTSWCHMSSTINFFYCNQNNFVTGFLFVKKIFLSLYVPTLFWETFLHIIYPSAISIAPIFSISLWTFFTRSCLMFATINKSYTNYNYNKYLLNLYLVLCM